MNHLNNGTKLNDQFKEHIDSFVWEIGSFDVYWVWKPQFANPIQPELCLYEALVFQGFVKAVEFIFVLNANHPVAYSSSP